ncbi:hypothetical protein GOODEAATRI_021966 [Goodea atripinnis]|uniref:IMD domain-containing protein n=1 Tax=Goodea atripinnis TaxID=208336 RepID=A0ABV0N3F3_9TELE
MLGSLDVGFVCSDVADLWLGFVFVGGESMSCRIGSGYAGRSFRLQVFVGGESMSCRIGSGWKDEARGQLDSALQDVNVRYAFLEETEKRAVCRALIEERSRYCSFVSMLKPVLVSALSHHSFTLVSASETLRVSSSMCHGRTMRSTCWGR